MLAKIINNETKEVAVANEAQREHFESIGFSDMEVEKGYDGKWYFQGYAPQPTKEYIRQKRQIRYTSEADPLRYDYDEALARGEETAETLKQEWLAKKDEIRADLPYPEES